MKRRLWALTSFVPVLAVGAALAMASVERRGGIGYGGAFSMTTHFSYGWPAIALNRSVSESIDFPTGQVTVWGVDRSWSMSGILIDLGSSLIVLASTTFACERWRRRTARRWQFSVRSLLTATTIAAILLCLYQNEFWLYLKLLPSHLFHGGLQLSPPHVAVPVAFGLGCVIYSISWVATRCVTRAGHFVRCRIGQCFTLRENSHGPYVSD
jgi:hypothetical protein